MKEEPKLCPKHNVRLVRVQNEDGSITGHCIKCDMES